MPQDDPKTFPQRVYEVVRGVPAGSLTTYGDVAAVVGNPRMARQVGWALSRLGADTDVPWQRVINRHGTISFRGEIGRSGKQRSLLEAEGIEFDESGRCELADHRWFHPDWRP